MVVRSPLVSASSQQLPGDAALLKSARQHLEDEAKDAAYEQAATESWWSCDSKRSKDQNKYICNMAKIKDAIALVHSRETNFHVPLQRTQIWRYVCNY